MKRELNESEMKQLCMASYDLLQIMSNLYGSDESMAMFDKFEDVFGKEVKANLFLYMLDSSFASGGLVGFGPGPSGFNNIINLIKAVREYGETDVPGVRYGLKEAKDIVDTARYSGVAYFKCKGPEARRQFLAVLKLEGGIEK